MQLLTRLLVTGIILFSPPIWGNQFVIDGPFDRLNSIITSDYYKSSYDQLRGDVLVQMDKYEKDAAVKRQVQILEKHLLSWIFLLDGSAHNPFVSEEIKRLQSEYPAACSQKIILNALENGLAQFDNQQAARILLFMRFRHHGFWANGKWHFFRPLTIEGTRSYDVYARRGFLNGSWHNGFEESLFETLNKVFHGDIEAIATITNSCQYQVSLTQIFPWWDLEDIADLINSTLPVKEISTHLDAFFQSTWSPDVQNHAPEAFALHPTLNLFTHSNLSPAFLQALLKYVPEKAYDDGYVTPESCQRITNVLAWWGVSGIVINPLDEAFAAVSKTDFDEWMKLKLTLFSAEEAGLKACGIPLRYIELIWPDSTYLRGSYQIIMRSSDFTKRTFKIKHALEETWEIQLTVDRELNSQQQIKKARSSSLFTSWW